MRAPPPLCLGLFPLCLCAVGVSCTRARCRGFFIFLCTITALLYNLAAVIVTAIVADVNNVASSIIFACIYVVIGVPGAWLMWYKRLYRAMIFDGAASFATFFFSFLIHIAFAIYSAVAPSPGGSLPSSNAHAGLLAALDIIKGSGGGNKLGGACTAPTWERHVVPPSSVSTPPPLVPERARRVVPARLLRRTRSPVCGGGWKRLSQANVPQRNCPEMRPHASVRRGLL